MDAPQQKRPGLSVRWLGRMERAQPVAAMASSLAAVAGLLVACVMGWYTVKLARQTLEQNEQLERERAIRENIPRVMFTLPESEATLKRTDSGWVIADGKPGLGPIRNVSGGTAFDCQVQWAVREVLSEGRPAERPGRMWGAYNSTRPHTIEHGEVADVTGLPAVFTGTDSGKLRLLKGTVAMMYRDSRNNSYRYEYDYQMRVEPIDDRTAKLLLDVAAFSNWDFDRCDPM